MSTETDVPRSRVKLDRFRVEKIFLGRGERIRFHKWQRGHKGVWKHVGN